jgi:nicotinamide-nucleotide amidase
MTPGRAPSLGDVETLTVGTELVLGLTVDTNAAEMARMLAEAGFRVRRHAAVSDQPADVRQALAVALDRSGTVIVTGGLGPTRDDLTRQAAAEVFGARLLRDEQVLAELEERFRRRGITPMPEANKRQADVPEGATVLPNPVGTAPGLWLDDGHGRLAVLLPGVPKEMRALMEQEVLPRLRQRRAEDAEPKTVVRSRTLRTVGIAESALADKVGDESRLLPPGVTLAWLPSTAGVDLRLTAWNLTEDEARAALAGGVEALRPRLGPYCYGEDDQDLAAVVLRALEERGATLAVAESCTGGWLGARLTAVPGSSRVFLGGVTAYANEVKLHLLGVSADAIAEHGSVSEVVARQMADGVARALGAQAAIAVTGIAGPDGGTVEKPVGTVWTAVRWDDEVRAFARIFPGDREDVRRRAAQWALDDLRRVLGAA